MKTDALSSAARRRRAAAAAALAFFAAGALGGCAAPFTERSNAVSRALLGGVSSEWTAPDRLRVAVTLQQGASANTEDRAFDFMLLHAAEKGRARGYPYFSYEETADGYFRDSRLFRRGAATFRMHRRRPRGRDAFASREVIADLAPKYR